MRLILICLIVGGVLLQGALSNSGLMRYYQLRNRISLVQQELDLTSRSIQEIESHIKNLESSVHAERYVRQYLGWVREGELVIEFQAQ